VNLGIAYWVGAENIRDAEGSFTATGVAWLPPRAQICLDCGLSVALYSKSLQMRHWRPTVYLLG